MNFYKYFTLILLLILFNSSKAQEIVTNGCTYKNFVSGKTITLLESGKIEINGKLDNTLAYSIKNNIVTILKNKKAINHLKVYKNEALKFIVIDDQKTQHQLTTCKGKPKKPELKVPKPVHYREPDCRLPIHQN